MDTREASKILTRLEQDLDAIRRQKAHALANPSLGLPNDDSAIVAKQAEIITFLKGAISSLSLSKKPPTVSTPTPEGRRQRSSR